MTFYLFLFWFSGCSNQPAAQPPGWTGANGAMTVDCRSEPERPLCIIWDESVADVDTVLTEISSFIKHSRCMVVDEVVFELASIDNASNLKKLIHKIHDQVGIPKVGIKVFPGDWSLVNELIQSVSDVLADYPNDQVIVSTKKASINDLALIRETKVSLSVPLGGLAKVVESSQIEVHRYYYEMSEFWFPSKANYSSKYGTPFRTIRPTSELVNFLSSGPDSPIPGSDLQILKWLPNVTIVVNVGNYMSQKCLRPTECRCSSSASIEFGALISLDDFMECLREIQKKIGGSNFAISSYSKIPTSWMIHK